MCTVEDYSSGCKMNERETHKNTMIEETLYVRCCDSDDSTTAKNICSAKCWFQNSVWFKKLLVVVAGSKQFDRLQKPHWRLHPIDRRTAHKKKQQQQQTNRTTKTNLVQMGSWFKHKKETHFVVARRRLVTLYCCCYCF